MAGGKGVTSRWNSSGNLEFQDSSGNVIMTLDGANQRVYFAERRSVVIPLSAFRELSSDDIPAVAIVSGGSGVMGKDSTPNFEAVNGATDRALQLQWATSNVDKISVTVTLPIDLDGTRALGLSLIAGKTGSMDTVAVTYSAWFDRGDTEVTATSANLANGTGAELTELSIAASDVSDTPGQLTLVLYPGTHANDTVELYGVRVNYWSKAAQLQAGKKGYLRGNEVTWDGKQWLTTDGADAHQSALICPKCEVGCLPGEPDPCLGFIAGAAGACCGHGLYTGYVNWPNTAAGPEWANGAFVGQMAGSSVTFTETITGSVKKIKAVWVSDNATGAASGTTTYPYSGKVELLTTVPAGGCSAPTDNYDITLKDSDLVDVLAGAGTDRDTANTEQVVGSSLGAVAGSVLTLAIANAGNSKGGTVYVYVR